MRTPPIGFTEPNFCAVLQGIKTETRRLLTLKGRTQEEVNELTSFCQDGDGNWIGHFGNTFGDLAELAEFTKAAYPKGSNKGVKPKYNVGDICYLTEPTQIDEFRGQATVDVQYFWHKSESLTKAVSKHDLNKIMERKTGCYSKQIARFMLKSFARYHIKITDVSLERLLDITEESAIAEGIETKNSLYLDYMTGEYIADPIQSYLSEIAAIHPPTKDKIGGWDLVKSNPWVWCYKMVITPPASSNQPPSA